jgi:hypothetical protein
MYIVFISKFILICPFIKAYIKAPINIIVQRANKMYGLDKSDILLIETLTQKDNKAIIYCLFLSSSNITFMLYLSFSVNKFSLKLLSI